MPLPVIPDTLRVAFNWRTDTQFAENVMHFGGSSVEAPQLAGFLATYVSGPMTESITGNASCPSISITPLNGLSASTDYPLANWSGNSSPTDWTPAAACVVSLRTARRGRSYRGRIFLPFTAEAALGAGTFSPAVAAQIGLAWTNFATNMAGNGHPLLVASYVHHTAEVVTSCNVNIAAGTVRRRQSRLRA